MADPPYRYILHADLDAFYASVEQLDNPDLQGRPVVVGGPPESRGVVAAASYEARACGIHSALSMRTALRLCPDAVRVSPRFGRYREVSHQVMAIFRNLTPLVEPLSMDEAYMDITAEVHPEAVDETAQGLRGRVKQETGLVITVGGGTSKTVAKIASQVAKPDGLLLIKPGQERGFLAPLNVGMLSGVGPKTTAILRAHGIETIGHLAEREGSWLRQILGKRGLEMKERAEGMDRHPVETQRETKSVSAEVTMPEDVDSEATLIGHIEDLTLNVSRRLGRAGLMGKTVHIKLRLANFSTFTRQTTLQHPTSDVDVIGQAARTLLLRELGPGRRFRLVGVGVSNFQSAFQLGLLPLTD